MTFIDLITALVLFGFFILGFSQAFLPAYTAWDTAMAEYRTAKTIFFVAESFRRECEKPGGNIENWKKQVSAAKELKNYEITELWQGDILRALKLVSIISGERVEIIGLCTP
jgi:hypothetical protein